MSSGEGSKTQQRAVSSSSDPSRQRREARDRTSALASGEDPLKMPRKEDKIPWLRGLLELVDAARGRVLGDRFGSGELDGEG